jgi:flagellar basal-body rod protein FlgB
VLEKTMAFAEARQHVLAQNLANVETPGYQARQLDVPAFQAALRRAIDRRRENPQAPLAIERSSQFRLDASGKLVVTPTLEPAENILFHDRTTTRIERFMTDLADNQLAHGVAAQLLKFHFDALKSAIKGTV